MTIEPAKRKPLCEPPTVTRDSVAIAGPDNPQIPARIARKSRLEILVPIVCHRAFLRWLINAQQLHIVPTLTVGIISNPHASVGAGGE
jgi:hypothetical protein